MMEDSFCHYCHLVVAVRAGEKENEKLDKNMQFSYWIIVDCSVKLKKVFSVSYF